VGYISRVIALLSGFAAGLSLIVAIGAQNAFVIKQGLMRSHVFLVVSVCALSDAGLIALGVGGLGQIIQAHPRILEFIRWVGVLYLAWFGIKSARSAYSSQSLELRNESQKSALKVFITVLTFTFLNPHVYLDTVIFLGIIANQFGANRWFFATGAAIASLCWFSTIGFGAKAASRFMTNPLFWKILDVVIAAIMFALATSLALFQFN
jgi:L-lysine exporter family protein LysE/ArgO